MQDCSLSNRLPKGSNTFLNFNRTSTWRSERSFFDQCSVESRQSTFFFGLLPGKEHPDAALTNAHSRKSFDSSMHQSQPGSEHAHVTDISSACAEAFSVLGHHEILVSTDYQGLFFMSTGSLPIAIQGISGG
jgi:hypothetical protein